jgi:hypothetical protein
MLLPLSGLTADQDVPSTEVRVPKLTLVPVGVCPCHVS